MDVPSAGVGQLIVRVRRRWQKLIALEAAKRAAVGAVSVVAVALVAALVVGRSSTALAALVVVATVLAAALVIRAFWPLRRAPSDLRVARFIEERDRSLESRLVSAVDMASRDEDAARPRLAALMLADADRHAAVVDPAAIVPGHRLRVAAGSAAGALLALIGLMVLARGTVSRSVDALSYTLFPERLALEVTPGDARVPVGASLAITARLAGSRAPVAARLERARDDAWSSVEMADETDGRFQATVESVTEAFRYRVVAGQLTSKTFEVTVLRPPRVTRIDVEYRYPPSLGLSARTDEDAGDIYAPADTHVRVLVHTDHETTTGELALGSGTSIPLKTVAPTVQEAAFTVAKDDAYRVHVSDRDGLRSSGDTEYFIRMLDDRPPEVRVLKPARDRSVTKLEEVDIQAEAQDDFGIDRLDLVYSVRGGAEKVVALPIPRRETAVTRAHTLYLEELGVAPGDFVSYYVRARDVARGRRASEARSDMFFLEVKPFEQEFSLAPSQAGAGGGGGQSLEELVNAQKEVIVATWKLDRRSQASKGARSPEDIEAVARAENALRVRVESVASASRASNMRDPRRRGPQPAVRAGQTTPEEDAMSAAALAMGEAVTLLSAHKTAEAMPAELEALNQLLKAQGEIKKRQVTRQAGVGSGGSNRSAPDLSSLFDKELQRLQQTNYETPNSAEERDESDASLLAKIRELATRQDELLRRQQELARDRQEMSAEELKRALETLSREQTELRQRAEAVAREMASQGQNAQSSSKPQSQPGQPGQQAQQGEQGQQRQGQQGQPRQSGQGQSQQSRAGQAQPSTGAAGEPSQDREASEAGAQQSRDEAASRSGQRRRQLATAAEQMRGAVSELRRDDPNQATARSAKALESLRELERQLRNESPDERRQAVGDLQLEARQLADAQRQVASALGRVGQGEAGRDARRRLAGEQDRLVDRANRLKKSLEGQAAQTSGSDAPRGTAADRPSVRSALGEAARELERQRLAERMQKAADAIRASSEHAGGSGPGSQSGEPAASSGDQSTRRAQDEIARSFERFADRLGGAAQARDGESQRLSEGLARARELREQMEATSEALEKFGQRPGDRLGRAPDGTSQGQESSSGKPSSQPGQPSSAESEVAALREQYRQQLRETQKLLDELGRDDRTGGRAGSGVTFEGQGMVLSAPGTEAFKQDFAKWEELRKQATEALERAESSLAQKLHARDTRDRLGSNVDDRAPAAYADQVDRYFRSLAEKAR